MCVKEVEGAQGQESPYRQEKACGGDGGGGGSRLLSDSSFLNTHSRTHRHGRKPLQATGSHSHYPLSRGGRRKKELDGFWLQSMHAPALTEEAGVKTHSYMPQCCHEHNNSSEPL